MKTIFVAATLVLAALFTTSCEQHNWSETRKLFKAHDSHGHGEAHGDDHGEKAGEHGKTDSHGEKKEAEAKH